ncbi:hypothetical protein ACHAXH_004205 [Discostella pseudostelligera]
MRPFILLIISCSHAASGFVSAGATTPPGRGVRTVLRGGYDATIGADPNTPIQFFAFSGKTCPYAQRTHIALLELGIPFDMTEITSMPKPDWYLKINPQGKVPALRVPTADYAVIYESAICNEFLCDYATTTQQSHNMGHHSLMPVVDPFARAKIRLLNLHCDNAFTKTQFTYLMNKNDELDEGLRDEMENALQPFEDSLVQSKGPYLMGNEFTLADLHLFPFIQRLVVTLKEWKGYELPQDKFPILLAWFPACMERESVKESSMTTDEIIEVYERFVSVDYKFGGLNKNK